MVSTWGKNKKSHVIGNCGLELHNVEKWLPYYFGKLLFLKHLSHPQYRNFHWWFYNIGFIGDCSFWRKLWNYFSTFFNYLSWIETKMESNVVNYKGVHQFIKPHCNLSLIIAKGLKVFRFPIRNVWKWKSYF